MKDQELGNGGLGWAVAIGKAAIGAGERIKVSDSSCQGSRPIEPIAWTADLARAKGAGCCVHARGASPTNPRRAGAPDLLRKLATRCSVGAGIRRVLLGPMQRGTGLRRNQPAEARGAAPGRRGCRRYRGRLMPRPRWGSKSCRCSSQGATKQVAQLLMSVGKVRND
jgi:hypothetical protein